MTCNNCNVDVENDGGIRSTTSTSYGSLHDVSHQHIQGNKNESSRESSASSSASNSGLSMHHVLHDDSSPSSATNTVRSTAITTEYGSDDFKGIDKTQYKTHCTEPHHPAHREHLHKSRQYYRDMMLGVNDGLVSTLLLVAGVVGGGMDVKSTLLTAVSGAIAGAISMFAGEYVATKSQNEVMTGVKEMQELSSLLSLIGLPDSSPNLSNDNNDNVEDTTEQHVANLLEARELKRRITRYYGSNPDALLKIMIALELGVIDEEIRSPLVAGGASLSLFFIGALPSTIPFAFVTDPVLGLVAAGVATGVFLMLVGAVKCWATRGNMLMAAMENLLITVFGGGVAFAIGIGFQNLIDR
ncbi:predicted protein [Thalassiosira pseudonana CCMP1335]|uniref:Uncharacterized protein n=1 Tax=Thalassiosira pseudonana TaxID=35128 RepID=B8C8F8_THAPS|nr:predicted protein [Thalassiosira pseudonana CCMP1335]EED90476.1 predicted protein [Thalassiosira pseudonana CCMP1335]